MSFSQLTKRFRSGAVLFASSILASLPAQSHRHVDGDGATVAWYPPECCNDRDCRPVASVRQAPQGLWMTTVDGKTVLVDLDEPRRLSRDMRWHLCLTTDIYSNIVIQCVFEPPSS